MYQILGAINFLVISLDFSNDNSNLFNFMNDSYIHSNSDEYTLYTNVDITLKT